MGHKEEAEQMFDKAYSLYSLFWGINMNLIDLGEVKKIGDDALDKDDVKNNESSIADKHETEVKSAVVADKDSGEKKGVMKSLKEMVRKAVDCCIE